MLADQVSQEESIHNPWQLKCHSTDQPSGVKTFDHGPSLHWSTSRCKSISSKFNAGSWLNTVLKPRHDFSITTMVQLLYQALQISASMGPCFWDPIYQGSPHKEMPYAPMIGHTYSNRCVLCVSCDHLVWSQTIERPNSEVTIVMLLPKPSACETWKSNFCFAARQHHTQSDK